MKTLRLTALAFIATLFSATPAIAQEGGTLKKIKDSGTIIVGHRESSIPFSYYNDQQQVIGYSQDLAGKIVEAVRAELKLPKLNVKLVPITAQNPASRSSRTAPSILNAARPPTIPNGRSRWRSATPSSSSAPA